MHCVGRKTLRLPDLGCLFTEHNHNDRARSDRRMHQTVHQFGMLTSPISILTHTCPVRHARGFGRSPRCTRWLASCRCTRSGCDSIVRTRQVRQQECGRGMGPYRPPRLEVEGSSPTWTREEWYPLHHGDDISSHVPGRTAGGRDEG